MGNRGEGEWGCIIESVHFTFEVASTSEAWLGSKIESVHFTFEVSFSMVWYYH